MSRKRLRSSQDVIGDIDSKLHSDAKLAGLLVESIKKAKDTGKKELDTDLYKAFDQIHGWPTTVEEWVSYARDLSRWIPNQSNNKAWKDPETGYSQEVYDRLCHFYFLIDQKVGPNGSKVVENDPYFSKWLVEYANLWGDFLNTTESFNDEVLKNFEEFSPQYDINDSLVDGKPNNPSGWLTFNQFFARELNPGLRPIDSPHDNTLVVCPADCTFRKKYPIDAESNVDEVILKKIHKIGNVNDLLKESPHADAFANGTFVHYFLAPFSYHRFHAPVSGIVDECRPLDGLTYLEVNLKDGQFDAPDNSEGGYQFNQARGLITIDATSEKHGNMGIVAVLPIGMAQVSGVHMTATKGREIAKGEEFGYFLFGGSDIILLFQEGKAPVIDKTDSYRHYGTNISKPTKS